MSPWDVVHGLAQVPWWVGYTLCGVSLIAIGIVWRQP